MVNFCRDIKKGGLMVLGSVIVGDLNDMVTSKHGLAPLNERIRSGWSKYITDRGIKAFPQEVIAPTVRLGYQFLMQGSGIGGLRCNTVALPLFSGPKHHDGEGDSGSTGAGVGGGAGLSSGGSLTGQRGASFYNDVADALAAGGRSPNPSKAAGGSSTNVSAPSSAELAASALDRGSAKFSEGKSSDATRLTRVTSMYSNVSADVASRLASNSGGNLPVAGPDEYLDVIEDALTLRKNVVVGCNVSMASQSYAHFYSAEFKRTGKKTSIDVWLLGEWSGHFGNTDAIVVQLASILQGRKQWRGISTLRVMCIPDNRARSFVLPAGEAPEDDAGVAEARLRQVELSLRRQLYNARITKVEVLAVGVDSGGSVLSSTSEHERATCLNDVIRKHSANAALILMGMPPRPTTSERQSAPGAARRYLSNVEVLVKSLPATYLVLAGEQRDIMTTDI